LAKYALTRRQFFEHDSKSHKPLTLVALESSTDRTRFEIEILQTEEASHDGDHESEADGSLQPAGHPRRPFPQLRVDRSGPADFDDSLGIGPRVDLGAQHVDERRGTSA
jgi:hypothetical protein